MSTQLVMIAIVFGAIGGVVGFYLDTALIKAIYRWAKNRKKSVTSKRRK